jgi:glycerophosphoryl diester phosphodiesterase
MKKSVVVQCLLLALLVSACTNPTDVPIPEFAQGGILTQTYPLTSQAKAKLEGVYLLEAGSDRFGERVVFKWAGDYLSVFTGKNVGYFVMKGGSLDSVVILEGYWRYQNSTETGLAQMMVPRDEGGRYLLGDTARSGTLRIRGNIGSGNGAPDQPVVFRYERPINPSLLTKKFQIIAHRAGGRTADHIPASENTVELIKIAERFGSTGIEIDVRLTKDKVPVLYHDGGLNLRLTQKGPMVGPVEDYTLAELKSFVWLLNGERIPTLEEALDAVVTQTKLTFVWLDTKTEQSGVITAYVPIAQKALQKAASMGRELEICAGIPTQEVYDEFVAYPNYQNIPSLCELSPENVRTINARVWGPRWTMGTQNDQVNAFHAEGRRAFTWTLDDPRYIEQYIRQGVFDGILSNYPMAVAYQYYIQ